MFAKVGSLRFSSAMRGCEVLLALREVWSKLALLSMLFLGSHKQEGEGELFGLVHMYHILQMMDKVMEENPILLIFPHCIQMDETCRFFLGGGGGQLKCQPSLAVTPRWVRLAHRERGLFGRRVPDSHLGLESRADKLKTLPRNLHTSDPILPVSKSKCCPLVH